ncbi:L,D-transpeptidase family protein [Methylolobus aquaticus]
MVRSYLTRRADGPAVPRYSLLALVLGLGGCAQMPWPRMEWPWPALASGSPPDITMQPPAGSREVDPRLGITLRAQGVGTRLERVEVRDGEDKPVSGAMKGDEYVVKPPLQFGSRYRVSAAGRSAAGEPITREFDFTTLAVPSLDGGTLRPIGPDSAVALSFDRAVGRLDIRSDLKAKVEPDTERRTFRIVVDGYPKGRTIPVEVQWETPSGVPLPPLALQLTSAPPLNANLSLQGQTNLGLALPVELRFAEPIVDREQVPAALRVQTAAGEPVDGRWQWLGDQRLRFTPKPRWPATSSIEVRAEPGRIRSAKGATNTAVLVGSFQTGADRKIVVYLDSQRLTAIENGQVVKTIKVSTGKPATPTVTGSYYIYARYPRKTMRSQAKPGEPGHYVVENVPYAQYFHADYALHGAWWHNGFGRPASHGCVNIPTRTNNRRWPKAPEEAGWLYDWAALGVPVTVQRSAAR